MDFITLVAFIGLLGIGSQYIAWRTNLPAIVLMSVAGLIAGPILGLLNPQEDFGAFLQPIISIAVAIILFEGGLSLNFRELKHAGRAVMRLVIPGVPLAWGLGAAAAYYLGGLSWPVAILFAGIMVVTGPTVIVPLLRQAKLSVKPRTVLKWEGIVNDPLGALLAVLVFEYLAYAGQDKPLLEIGLWMLFVSLVAGLIGFIFARFIAYIFPRGWVPEYLKAPVLLVAVLTCFALADAIEHEMGLLAVTAMGVVLANAKLASLGDLRRFKENITILLVSGIFVILTASLERDVWAGLDWHLLAFLGAMLFIVRPLAVILSTFGANLTWSERLFVGWIAPRGIVAVAVSGFVALTLTELGYEDAEQLIPFSFAMVFATILAHGFTIAPLGRALGLASTSQPGALIVGSTPWSVALAKTLQAMEIPITIADSSWHRLRHARLADIPVYYGEILSEVSEHHVDLQQFGTLLAVTGNEAYNALVCRELGAELGRANVFQLGTADDDDPHGLSLSVRGTSLFDGRLDLNDVLRAHFSGWTFQRTTLSEEYGFDAYKADRPEEAERMFYVHKGEIVGSLKAETGDTIITFVPPKSEKQD
ncbi:MAG: sodium:proton antiporter [Sphingomonadales bacterium]|jgi:NhaP-type Na+/H+ or K+/H+ antiporter